MGEITVHDAALREGARKLDEAAADVEAAVGDSAVPALAEAEHGLAGSVTAAAVLGVNRQLVEVSADLVMAMRGVSQGLERVADRFRAVDHAFGRAAAGYHRRSRGARDRSPSGDRSPSCEAGQEPGR